MLLAGLSVAAHGHEVWMNAAHTHGGGVLKAELSYGHYPELGPITADRLLLFPKPLQLLTPQGKIDLMRRGQHNYQFEMPRAVAEPDADERCHLLRANQYVWQSGGEHRARERE